MVIIWCLHVLNQIFSGWWHILPGKVDNMIADFTEEMRLWLLNPVGKSAPLKYFITGQGEHSGWLGLQNFSHAMKKEVEQLQPRDFMDLARWVQRRVTNEKPYLNADSPHLNGEPITEAEAKALRLFLAVLRGCTLEYAKATISTAWAHHRYGDKINSRPFTDLAVVPDFDLSGREGESNRRPKVVPMLRPERRP
jgi:hypothetical protein